jgi:GNAT superfamily N-acetyltransferase
MIITNIVHKENTNVIIKILIDDVVVSSIHLIVNINEISGMIISLHTIKEYRNRGFATILLNRIIEYCKINHLQEIFLDDCSDNFNQPNNIYLNCGFVYIEPGSPEMIMKIN